MQRTQGNTTRAPPDPVSVAPLIGEIETRNGSPDSKKPIRALNWRIHSLSPRRYCARLPPAYGPRPAGRGPGLSRDKPAPAAATARPRKYGASYGGDV